MKSIEIVGWSKDADDFKGKERSEIFHVILDGREVALSRADLVTQIKLNTEERHKPEPKTPLLDKIENGHAVESR